ncbi:MAG: Asp-tRNA(Asn)/Glu-tRNA(Gln) amidotransferase subunit GatC [Patescibacteria group bacterium]
MKIDVKKVAKLANLPLTSDEEEKYSQQLSKILDYIEQLNKVDTSKVEPTYNVSGQKNIQRADEIGECQPQNDAILNAPQKKEGFFSVKKILDNE